MEDRKDSPTDPDRRREPGADLESRLHAAQQRMRPAGKVRQTSELGAAMRIAVDLVAGLAVGVAIGVGLDYAFGTGPWLLLLFFVLGAGAGIRNVMKTAQRMEAERRRPGGTAKRDERPDAQ